MSVGAEIFEAQGDELVPVATFKQHGGPVPTDALHETGVAVVDGALIHHRHRGTGQDRSGGSHEIEDQSWGHYRQVPQELSSVASDSNSQTASADEEWLAVGKVVGAQGLRGELRINPASDFPERFTTPGPRWLKAQGSTPKKIELNSGRQLPGKNVFVVRFTGVDSRDAAKALVGQTLMVPADDRPELDEGEFHLLDLVGLEARLENPTEVIGTVSDLISGGNDLLEITRLDGRKLLIPFVDSIVPEVHLEEGWLLLTPPPGLLDL